METTLIIVFLVACLLVVLVLVEAHQKMCRDVEELASRIHAQILQTVISTRIERELKMETLWRSDKDLNSEPFARSTVIVRMDEGTTVTFKPLLVLRPAEKNFLNLLSSALSNVPGTESRIVD